MEQAEEGQRELVRDTDGRNGFELRPVYFILKDQKKGEVSVCMYH